MRLEYMIGDYRHLDSLKLSRWKTTKSRHDFLRLENPNEVLGVRVMHVQRQAFELTESKDVDLGCIS